MNVSVTVALAFAVYTLGILAVGAVSWFYRRRGLEDYFLAGRTLGPWLTSLSASASSESGWVMLGLVGAAFSGGVSCLWLVPGCAAGYLFNWYWVAPRLRRASQVKGSITLPQFLADRLGGRAVRYVAAIIVLIAMIAYVSAQMTAAGKAFDATFGVPYEIGVILGAAIIITYTTLGGFRAVAWTDSIQALLMIGALVILPFLTVVEVGGFKAMADALREQDPNLLSLSAGKAGIALLGFTIGWLGVGLGYPGLPHVLVRFMAAKDDNALRRGGLIALVWSMTAFLGAILLGLACRALFHELGDAEQSLPIVAVRLLPGVLAGLMLAAVLAAICSTADSQLLVCASAVSHDMRRLAPTGQSRHGSHNTTEGTSRWVVAGLGLLAMLAALTENRVVFTFVLYAWSVLGAAFGPVLILTLAWKRMSKTGALAGMVAGTVVTVVWKNVPALSSAVYELVPAFVAAFTVAVAVSVVARPAHGRRRPRASGSAEDGTTRVSPDRGDAR